jgi:DNA invertase Pin-like site-specific DNA recombinase
LIVWRFDRFARSVKHLVLALEEFQSLGIGFVSYQEALDTSTPIGKAMFTIIGAMAELERNVIRERVRAGVRNARRNGRVLGRKRVVFDRSRAIELHAGGSSVRDIATTLGIDRGVVHRFLVSQKPPAVAASQASGIGSRGMVRFLDTKRNDAVEKVIGAGSLQTRRKNDVIRSPIHDRR